MKKLYFLLLTLCAFCIANAQLINEFQPNPSGTEAAGSMWDFEISGTPGATFSGWVISIEGDNLGLGSVNDATMVSGTFGANGLLVVSIPDLENPTFTIILTDTFSGAEGDDLDTDDDGTLDVTPWTTVYDAIGIPDNVGSGATVYGAQLGGVDFAFTGDEPQSVFRDGTTGDWYAVNDPAGTNVFDITATAVPGVDFDTNPTTTPSSFGATNPSVSTASTQNFTGLEISIFPNPVSNGVVTIKTTSNEAVNIFVFDVLGKQVISKIITNNTLNVASLNAGVYIMQLNQNGATTTKKLVVK